MRLRARVHHVSSVRHSSGNEREVRGRQDKGRIDAVAARAINILREALFQDVIGAAVGPYLTGEGRITVSGPPLIVKPRQALALSLAIHELATNALKYGSLSVTSGRVSITWSSEDYAGEAQFVFVWQEFGGPPVSEPISVGFGSRLISRVLKDDFGGSVDVSYGSTGVTRCLKAPIKNLAPHQNNE